MKMKLLWCCLMVALMMEFSKAAIDVERTVQQVQSILQANIQLPRLSRNEILQLLNDIRAEDAKSTSTSKEQSKENESITTTFNTIDNEINEINPVTQLSYIDEQTASNENKTVTELTSTTSSPETTTKSEPTLMVVLPYTPRDGSSLQELYTRPPRVKVVPVSKVTPKPNESSKTKQKIEDTLKYNAKLANQKKLDLPDELQAFLDAHGLKGKPGQDNFLLPLDGFKPLPPATIVDDSVQLPENILLTYDLISPDTDLKQLKTGAQSAAHNYLFEPLRPESPFELDTSSSETKEITYPYDMPKSRKTKAAGNPVPNYEPIDYDAVKVIPLIKGINPLEENKSPLNNDQNKRQIKNNETTTEEVETTSTTSTTTTEEPKSVVADSASADTDSGANIAALEDSFGGAAPEKPGDSELPPPRKNGFYWMVDWNSFLEVGDGDRQVNIRFEPKLGDPQMFLPVTVP